MCAVYFAFFAVSLALLHATCSYMCSKHHSSDALVMKTIHIVVGHGRGYHNIDRHVVGSAVFSGYVPLQQELRYVRANFFSL